MNMDRFEKGPREILNPEIQKVRDESHPISAVCTALHPWTRPSLLEFCEGLWIFTLSSLLRICWCWRSRRYRLTKIPSYFLIILHISLILLLQNYHLLMYLLTPMILQGSVNFKFGVLYAKEGQLTDDEMFSNGKFLSVSAIWSFQLKINPQKLVVNRCASIYILYHPNLNGCRSWHHLNVLHFQTVLTKEKLSKRCCVCFRDGERELW